MQKSDLDLKSELGKKKSISTAKPNQGNQKNNFIVIKENEFI